MRATVAVVSFNTAAHLPGVLATLAAQGGAAAGRPSPIDEVVVIDNASADGSADVARRAAPDATVVVNARNLGYAGAANQALARAERNGSEALVLLNPDVRLEPHAVARALAALAADDRTASVQPKLWRLPVGVDVDAAAAAADAAGGRVLDTTGHLAFRTRLFRNRGDGERDRGQYDGPAWADVFGTSGACAAYRVAALHDVAVDGEVFDEDLFAFWEDVDLDWRLQLRGWRARFAPDAAGWHERGGAGVRRSAVVERLNFANRLLVVLKDDDPRALARAAPGVAVTTTLKAVELAATVPSAFLSSFGAATVVPRMLRKRATVQRTAAVPAEDVARRWFEPFDYPAWVRTWWRRVRGSTGVAA